MKRRLLRSLVGGLIALGWWGTALSPAYAVGLSVPVFGQRSPLWAQDPLGTDLEDTIGTAGCVVTDVAMVQSAFGYRTTPQALNRWLTQHGGYVEDDLLLWRHAMVPTNGGVRWKWLHIPGIVPQLRWDDQDINDRPTAAAVQGELDAGHLVVAEVRLNGNMHFVVLTGRRADTFFINDPWFADQTTLEQRYGDYDHAVRSAQIYYRTN